MKPKEVVKTMAQPRAGETLDGALGVRALGHVLDVGGLDLVAECLLDHLPADVVACW